jgi:hypothetical protein
MGRSRWDVDRGQDPRRGARVENLALVPASLLPYKTTYQRLANQLPRGAVLVVLPTEDTPERHGLQEAAARLRAKGYAIATLSVDEVLAQAGRRRAPRRASAAPRTESPLVPSPPPPTPTVDLAAPLPPTAPTVEPLSPALPPADQLPSFVQELRLVRIDAGTGPARYEVYQWQPTLWGGVALVRLRGALGQSPQVQTLAEAATPHLDARHTALVRRRLHAGYRIADWQ